MDKSLIFAVKGGTQSLLDFTLLDDTKLLFYENFIYILFTSSQQPSAPTLTASQLVLTSTNNKVYIDYKESGNRSQLWRLTSEGFLVHEGSSPPKEITQNNAELVGNRYVLDIEDVAPQPNRCMPLTLRRPDSRRHNTQKWSFHADGLLCCRVLNMCLQIEGSLVQKARVVLGPARNLTPANRVYVARESLRPGSGSLSVEMITDGPTRVITVANINERSAGMIRWEKEKELAEEDVKGLKRSLEVYVNLTGGIGISLVHWLDQEYEELVYGYLKSLEVNFEQDSMEQKLMLNVQTIQVRFILIFFVLRLPKTDKKYLLLFIIFLYIFTIQLHLLTIFS